MIEKYVQATRDQVLAALRSASISPRIDKMTRYTTWQYVLIADALEAAAHPRYKTPRATIEVRLYVTPRAGVYGSQFLAAIWVHTAGTWHQASGSLTSDYGYDKPSEAVDSAIRALGLTTAMVAPFDGTGQHEQVMCELMDLLAAGEPWIMFNR